MTVIETRPMESTDVQLRKSKKETLKKPVFVDENMCGNEMDVDTMPALDSMDDVKQIERALVQGLECDAGTAKTVAKFLVPLLDTESAERAANCLALLAHATEGVTERCVIESLCKAVMSQNSNVSSMAIHALGNIATDSREVRQTLAQEELFLDKVVDERQAWVLRNLCSSARTPMTVVTRLIKMLDDPAPDAIAEALEGLVFVTNREEGLRDVLSFDILPTFMELLNKRDDDILSKVLRICGNITCGEEADTQLVLDAGVLKKMPALLSSVRAATRKCALWLLSNIAAGTEEQVNLLLQSGILPYVFELLQEGVWEIKREALWVVVNATQKGTQEVVHMLVRLGLIPALTSFLDVNDVQALEHTLKALEKVLEVAKSDDTQAYAYRDMFEVCGGLEKIENLIFSDQVPPMVSSRAADIQMKYLVEEEAVVEQTPEPPKTYNFSSA